MPTTRLSFKTRSRSFVGRRLKATLGWVLNQKMLRPFGKPILRAIAYGLSLKDIHLVSFRRDQQWISHLIKKIRSERKLLIRNDEAANILLAVLATEKLQGDLAEVGVYQGASAKLICEAKGQRTLHLFDTFEGLPEPGEMDDAVFSAGEFRCGLDEVKQFLSGYPNIHYYRGLFPSTAGPVKDRFFSFVNLDVDLYESTKQALEFFYPRMVVSGIIISHDYHGVPAVRRAIDEFFVNKSEVVLSLLGNQCSIQRASWGSQSLAASAEGVSGKFASL